MEIMWTVDDIEGSVDPDDVLGSIVLKSAAGEIRDRCVYLVDWFMVLVDGLLALKQGKSLSADLVSEPDPVDFRLVGDTTQITYRGDTLTVPVAELEQAMRDSARELLDFVSASSSPSASLKAWGRVSDFARVHDGLEG